jgi:hypothetical protein
MQVPQQPPPKEGRPRGLFEAFGEGKMVIAKHQSAIIHHWLILLSFSQKMMRQFLRN